MQLFQIYQSEESHKITINAHTPNCPLYELPITGVLLYINAYIMMSIFENPRPDHAVGGSEDMAGRDEGTSTPVDSLCLNILMNCLR